MTKSLGLIFLNRIVATLFIIASQLAWATPSQEVATAKALRRPNIIFILVDDFSMNLLPWMRHVENRVGVSGFKELAKDGTVFSNFFVTNSLCCPSRASIFTSKYPHNTGVFTNVWNPAAGKLDGGFGAFNNNSNQLRTFAVALQQAGYTTAMLGKYLNGYLPSSDQPYNKDKLWTTLWGWDEWHVGGNGYAEYDYDLNENGVVNHYGSSPQDYMTDRLSIIAQQFIKKARSPFFLEISTFSPHEPYTPAERDKNLYYDAKIPRGLSYAARPDDNAPGWLKNTKPLPDHFKLRMDGYFRLRAQAARSVDKMIADIRATLKAIGEEDNTYIFFAADNGFHMGEYSLPPGKTTPFDSDIHVPLVVVGPGVAKQTLNHVVQTVDLAPTFADIAGGALPAGADGRSVLGLLRGRLSAAWRNVALIEHHGPPDDPNDPDYMSQKSPQDAIKPPDYEALRAKDYLYVEYYNNTDCPLNNPHCNQTATEISYYDLTTDPGELKNIYNSLPQAKKRALKLAMERNKTCGQAVGESCWQVQ